jgi:hypothetical protein
LQQGWRVFQEALGLGIRLQQPLDPAAQFLITSANVVEIGTSLLKRRHFHSGQEDIFDR